MSSIEIVDPEACKPTSPENHRRALGRDPASVRLSHMTWPLILAEYGGVCVLEDQDLVTETGREALVIEA